MTDISLSQDINDIRPPVVPIEISSADPFAPEGALSRLGSAVFKADQEPGLPVSEILSLIGKLSYTPDWITQDEANKHNLEARNLGKAVILAGGTLINNENAKHHVELLSLFLSDTTQEFLRRVYQLIRPGESEDLLATGAFYPIDMQGNQMNQKFQYIGRHDHAEDGRSDITTVLVVKFLPGFSDGDVHHVIEANIDGGVQELSTPSQKGDLIVSDSRVNHRVPKIKDHDTDRITFAINWKLVAE